MKITVSFCDDALSIATLELEPHLLERILFGARAIEDTVVSVSDPGGARRWIHDSTGRAVRCRRIVDAIELARRRAQAQQRRLVTI